MSAFCELVKINCTYSETGCSDCALNIAYQQDRENEKRNLLLANYCIWKDIKTMTIKAENAARLSKKFEGILFNFSEYDILCNKFNHLINRINFEIMEAIQNGKMFCIYSIDEEIDFFDLNKIFNHYKKSGYIIKYDEINEKLLISWADLIEE